MGDFILERINSDQKIILKRNETYTYGRDQNNEIVIPSLEISRKHCVFIVSSLNVKIIDSGSSNGVYMNGKKIPKNTPTSVQIDDTIGIACESLDDIGQNQFVYKLKRCGVNEVANKRKLKTEISEIPSKIVKTEHADFPEIVTLEDDDIQAVNPVPHVQIPVQVSVHTSKLPQNNNVRTSEVKQESSLAKGHFNVDIEIIDLEESEPVQNCNISSSINQDDQDIPMVQLPLDITIPYPAFLKQEMISSTNTDIDNDPNSSVTNPHCIKYEEVLSDDQDLFSDSPSPQPSASVIKQERISPNFNYLNNHYSQEEIIYLSDDENEDFFPPSQIFNDVSTNCSVSIDNVINIKQESVVTHGELVDHYDEYDIPLIELTDEEDDDDDDDENTKAWRKKLLGSQLENQEVQETKPKILQSEYMMNEDSEDEVREVEYGQLKDSPESEEVECGQTNDPIINKTIEKVDGNDLMEVAERIEDSKVPDRNDITSEVEEKTKKYDKKKEYDKVVDEKSKKEDGLEKKKIKTESKNNLKIENKRQSIEQPESTSCPSLVLTIKKGSNSVLYVVPKENTECHDKKIQDNLHKNRAIKYNRCTSADKLQGVKEVDSQSELVCDKVAVKDNLSLSRKDPKTGRIKNKRNSADKTGVENDEQAKSHGKEDLNEKKRNDKNRKERRNSRRSSSTEDKLGAIQEPDTTSNRSYLLDEVNEDSGINAVQKDACVSEKLENTKKNKDENPKTDKWIKVSSKKEKKIMEVDPPFLPKGERRGVSINITSNSTGTLKDNSESSDDDVFTSNKKLLTKRQGKEDEQSLNDISDKKNKKLTRVKNKLKESSYIRKSALTNEAKRRIKEQRSEKLKQLGSKSDESKKPEDNSNVKRINKPRVKVSEKNRGAFLTADAEENSSDNTSDEDDGVVERLVVPKSLELQQNTAAMDLSDVISGNSSSFADAKPRKVQNKPKKTTGKEKKNEIKKADKSVGLAVKKNDIVRAIKEVNNDNNINNNNNDNTNNKNKPSIKSNVKVTDSITVINLNLKKKKTVRFNTKTTIHTFLIEPGNTLTRCLQKDRKIEKRYPNRESIKPQVDCPKIELFLSKIFNWRPDWLSKQLELQTLPPIVNKEDISQASKTYSTYNDYYKVMSTLMLLETWSIMSKDYELTRSKRPVLYSSIVEHSICKKKVDSSSNVEVMELMLEALVTEQAIQQRAYPVYGDLVMVELVGLHEEKTKFVHVFAYITALNYTTITPTTRYNTVLNRIIKNPHTLMTYTILTKSLPIILRAQKPGRLQTITYLRSHMRMVQALHYLPQSPLDEAIFHPEQTPEAYKLPIVSDYKSHTLITKENLNKKQRESVLRITEAVMNENPGICLVQGPPGTGKSKVIINLITEILYGNKINDGKILVCAPSNAAVDEINVRLLAVRKIVEDRGHKIKMVRIGRPEAVSPAVKSIHVTELARRDVDKTLLECRSTGRTIHEWEKQKENISARIIALKDELSTKSLSEAQKQNLLLKLATARTRYELLHSNPLASLNPKLHMKLRQASENSILAGANIITCTLSSCYTNQMEAIFGKNHEKISVCIVDEATQSSEPETLIPLMLGVKSLVLVGDPNQLPATVISKEAKELGFDKSLFARIQSIFDGKQNDPVVMLDTQYRMSRPIVNFPNRYFYKNAIQSVPHKDRLPFQFYKIFNLTSCQDHSNKFSNTDEATFVANLIYTMTTYSNLNKFDKLGIGIITPYNDQRMLINKKLTGRMSEVPEEIKKKVITEVNTVDSFQGQERDVVIMSCVRSSGIGFLSDRQRLCVALTRAKYSLILCGNFKTFEKDPMWLELLNDARNRNIYINLDHKAEPEKIKELIIK